MLIDAGSLALLGSLPVRARLLVQGALSGLHRAAHRGSSVEFAEHKQYSPGDEIRHIDWKVYAKQGRYFVKQFDQESQLTVYLVLDASGSMNFAGGGAQKLDYAATLLACVAYLVGQQQDKVGLVVFGGSSPQVLPATGRMTVRDIMTGLESTCANPGAGNGGAAVALQKIAELNRRRRALIIIASDFFDPSNAAVPALRELRAMGHDISVTHILAPHELTFPYDGMTLFESLESDHKMLANPAAIRQEYLRKMTEFLQTCKSDLVNAGIDYHVMQTNEPVDDALRRLLIARNALMRGRA